MPIQENENLFERSKKIAPGGVHSPVRSFKNLGISPIFFKSAQGAKLCSVENKEYIDFCMSFGPMILGHRDPDVQEKVLSMIHTAWSFGACEPYSLELAEWICARIPWVEKIRFVNSGTEAVMSALRIARAATGRDKVLKFEGCYHGHLDSLLVKAGSGLAGIAASTSAGVSNQVAADTIVCPLNDEALLEKVFLEHGKQLACAVIEPLPANYGLLLQRKEFLLKLAALCKSHGTLLFFDEVISGFRVGLGGMAEILGIKPDLVTYGKIIGGGFPVGAYGGRADLLNLVAPLGPVYQAGTLSANPVGMTAGLASLQKLERDNTWKKIDQNTIQFVNTIRKNFENTNFGISSFSSLFWIHPKASEIRSTQQIPINLSESFAPLFKSALQAGIYLAPNAYEVGFVSAAHTNDLLDYTANKLGEAARSV